MKEQILVILLLAGGGALFFTAWDWVRREYLVPGLIEALEDIDSQYAWSKMTVNAATVGLGEIQRLQNRLWIISDTGEREYWRDTLAKVAQKCLDFTEA